MKRFLLIKMFLKQLPRSVKLTLGMVSAYIAVTIVIAPFPDDINGMGIAKFLMSMWSTLFIVMCSALLRTAWQKWRKNNPQPTGS